MNRASHWLQRFAALALVVGACAAQAAPPPLYAFGPDATGTGREFTPLPPASSAALGAGDVSFNGGLVFGGSNFYTVGNDSFGASSLYGFGSDLNLSAGTSIGVGFYGGLGLNASSSTLYGIASDVSGYGSLYSFGVDGSSVSLVGGLGYGYFGGLAFNSDDGYLYALSDSLGAGAQRELQKIDVATGAVTSLFALGDGSMSFNGGLAYDAASDTFYVIGNGASGSALYHFDLSGASTLTADGAAFAAGYVNAGLAIGPAGVTVPVTPVPEPSTVWLLLAGGTLLAGVRRLRR